jgi:hypothetical protein
MSPLSKVQDESDDDFVLTGNIYAIVIIATVQLITLQKTAYELLELSFKIRSPCHEGDGAESQTIDIISGATWRTTLQNYTRQLHYTRQLPVNCIDY